MFLTFVAAVGNVGLKDVAVAGFQLFQDGGFVDYAEAAVVGECAEKNGVLAVFGIYGTELGEVFSEEGVCLFLSELDTSAIWLTRLDLMSVADIGPVLRLVERLEFLDYQNCPLKERQFHDTSLCGENRRCDRDGHYRHKEYQESSHRIIGEIETTNRQLKTDLNLRPIYHQKDVRSDAHIFFGLLSYWVVNTIRYQLKQHDIKCYWTEIVRRMDTQILVTTEVLNGNGDKVELRQCSKPSKQAQEIYRALGYREAPFKKRKICRSQPPPA